MKREDVIRSPSRSFLRTVIVVALAAFVLGMAWLNTLVASNYVLGGYDAIIRTDFVVRSVLPHSAAATAGLQAGDKIDVQNLDTAQRMIVLGEGRWMLPGELVQFTVFRNGIRIPITVHAVATPASIYLVVIKRIAGTIFVAIASLLVLLRPSRMLWGFYLFAIGSVLGSPLILGRSPVWLQLPVGELFSFVFYGAFLMAGLWIFVSRFPGDRAEGWRVWIDRAAIPTGVLLACGEILSNTLFSAAIPQPEIVGRLFMPEPSGQNLLLVGALTLGVLCLFSGFAHLQSDDRQRFKWVFAGFVVYLAALAYTLVAAYLPSLGWPVAWSNAGFGSNVLLGVQVVIPLAVAYAVLKHRVLDINFVISRALVYATMTSIIVIIFALIDWLFVRKLAATNLGVLAEIIAAIALGFWLNGLHHRVDAFTDRVFFRQRHRAELRLARIATTLPHASARAAVDDLLVSEPVDAFDLASAALFTLGADGSYMRGKSIGWPDDCAKSLGLDDAVVLHVRSHLSAFKVSEIHWPRQDLPRDNAYPALALPIIVRNQVIAIALYGAHNNGADLDPDEIKAIAGLAPGAAAAYDHLEAESMKQKLDTMNERVKSLEAQLAEAQIQPA